MRLKLKNFKAWEEAEFEFADTGVTLLSGPSGAGKTSILQAIYFALYGAGNKVTRHGNTSCRVEFTFGSLNVVRTKRPNRVVLTCADGTFEDAPAQAILDRMFGKNFDTVSYVEQDSARNLLAMTPGARLEFLESFAFENVDIERLKENLKAETKTRETNAAAAKSALETCRLLLARTPIPTGVGTPSVEEGDISKLSGAVAALEQQIARAELAMQKSVEERKRIELAARELASVERSIADVGYCGDARFRALRTLLETLEAAEEKQRLVRERDALREECAATLAGETEMHARRVEDAGKRVWSRLPERDAAELLRCLEIRAERSSQRKACVQRLAELEPDYLQYLAELPRAGTVAQCPSCACSLTVVATAEGSRLFAGSDVDEKSRAAVKRLAPVYKEYVKTKSQLEDLEKDTPLTFEGEVEWTLPTLQKYIRENVQLEAVRGAPFQPSATLVALRKRLAEAEACRGRFLPLSAADAAARPAEDIGEIRRAVSLEESKRIVHAPLARKKVELEKVLENKNLGSEEFHFDKLKSELADARGALTAAFEAKIEWDAYRAYADAAERRSRAEAAVCAAEERLAACDRELVAATRLKSVILDAESASLESVVSTLNMHAQTLLEAFFPTNPIAVSLATFKDMKTYKKPTIDIRVEYKGSETDVGSLSGGERARVALAYTLALAELQGAKMLLLDESISSLDYDATVDVLEALKGVDRPIICISHQANTGMFDSVVAV